MNILYRKRVIIISLILVMVTFLSGCSTDLEGVVAVVNGEKITVEEFDKEFGYHRLSYEKQLGEEALTQVGPDGKTLESIIKKNVLDTLIVERLINKDLKDKKISITEEEIDGQIEELKSSLGGEEKFEEFLESNTMDHDEFREYLRNDLMFKKHREDFLSKVKVEDKEARDFFDKNSEELVIVKARHILLSSQEDGERVLKALNDGDSFEELAIMESKDSTSAVNGGDLGYIVKGKYAAVKEFEKAIFELEAGETSEVIKTEVGYHIIRVDERKDTYEELKEEILSLLKNEKYTNYVEELEDKAKIKIYMEII